jgi:DNA-directed RNA polymerase subunit RPC12/RpoP
MFFFFIGGVGPRTTTLDQQERQCPNCGRLTLYLKRTDQYFSLFFIPLFRVKKGEPFLKCGNCKATYDQHGRRGQEEQTFGGQKCPFCGRQRDLDFKYCPECGKRL